MFDTVTIGGILATDQQVFHELLQMCEWRRIGEQAQIFAAEFIAMIDEELCGCRHIWLRR